MIPIGLREQTNHRITMEEVPTSRDMPPVLLLAFTVRRSIFRQSIILVSTLGY